MIKIVYYFPAFPQSSFHALKKLLLSHTTAFDLYSPRLQQVPPKHNPGAGCRC